MLAMPYLSTLRTWLLMGLLFGLSGCTWFSGKFEEPTVELASVEVIRARLLSQEFLLRFRIDNPNDSSLRIRGLEYVVHLDDVELANGESGSWAYIPANGTAYYDVPVYTSLWKDLRSLIRLLEKSRKPIPYTLKGQLRIGMMFRHQVPVSYRGEVMPRKFIPD